LLQALEDSYSPIRREALRNLVALFPQESEAWLERGLFDPSPSVRATARFHLNARGQAISVRYREALATADGRRLRATLAGLAETGSAADMVPLRPFLAHPQAGVRIAAVRALAVLAPESAAQVLSPMLGDESPAVAKCVYRCLLPHAAALDREWLLSNARHGGAMGQRAVALIAALPRWEAILRLLRLINRMPPAASAQERSLLAGLLPGFLRPSAEELTAVLSELELFVAQSHAERAWAEHLRAVSKVHKPMPPA
jgi:HEAT repeat protein